VHPFFQSFSLNEPQKVIYDQLVSLFAENFETEAWICFSQFLEKAQKQMLSFSADFDSILFYFDHADPKDHQNFIKNLLFYFDTSILSLPLIRELIKYLNKEDQIKAKKLHHVQ